MNPSPAVEASADRILPRRRQLRWRLVLSFVSLSIILVAIVEAVTLTQMHTQAQQQVFRQLESVAQLKQHQLTRWLDANTTALDLLLTGPTASELTMFAAAPTSHRAEQPLVNQILKAAVNVHTTPLNDDHDFRRVFLYTADGHIVAASDEAWIGRVVTRQPYFEPSLAKHYVQPPYYLVGSGTLTMVITHPLIDRAGRTIGVVAGELDLAALGTILLERNGLGESGETYLVSGENNYLLTPSRFAGYPLMQAYHSTAIDRALHGENGLGTYDNYRSPSISVLGVYRWIPEMQAALVAEVALSEALAPATEARNTSIALATIVTLLAAMVGLYHATQLSRPIVALTEAAAQLGRGRLDYRAKVDQRNEIGILATVFNQMASQLQAIQAGLEQRVIERTEELEQTLAELQALTNKLEQRNHELQVSLADRQKAETALRESEARFRLLFANNPLPMWVYDLHTLAFLEVNEAAIRHYGFTRADFLNMRITDVRPPEDIPQLLAQVNQPRPTIESSGPWRHCLKDGRMIDVTVHSHTLEFAGGQAALVVVEDITARQRADAAIKRLTADLERRVEERTADLRAANAELARAARLKDEFLASMSHELRTPLNTILGMTESLEEGIYGALNQEQTAALRQVSESGRHLLALINDILDLSKIEAGKLNLSIEDVEIAQVCQASVRFVAPAAARKRLDVSLQIDPAVTVLQADTRRLKQMLVNLLSNAVKFTPEGGAIGLEVVGDAATQSVHLAVWDTGIGIAPDDTARLFQPFVQLDSRLSRHYAGTGLGLALVDRMVTLHDGSVTVESALGQGSRFTLTLPWRATPVVAPSEPTTVPAHAAGASSELIPPAHPGAPGSQPHLPAPIILVVDDDERNIATVTPYLAAKAYRVVVARNGIEALSRIHDATPALVLMDIQMPGMDGLEAIRRIRADTTGATIQIIALTALAVAGHRERRLAAGADDYLSKPVRLKELVMAIDALLHASEHTH